MTNDLNTHAQHKMIGPQAFLPREVLSSLSPHLHGSDSSHPVSQRLYEPDSLYRSDSSHPVVSHPVAPLPSLPDWASALEATPIVVKGIESNTASWQSRFRWKRAIAVLSVLCLCIIALSLWLTARGATDVTLYQVGNQNVTHTIGGGGIVFPYQQLTISYPSTERVVSVMVKPGDTVTLNQPLLQLDPKQLSAQITQAANDVAAAQAYLGSVSVGGNALTIAQAQQEYQLAKNKYNALVAQTSSTILHSGNIIAPLAGVVTAVNINAGEVFAANTSLVTIMDESKVVVRVKIPLINLQQIKVGQSASITPSALPSVNLTGTVSAIIPQADPQTDTFEVWIQVVNANGTLLPGMSAFARIQEKSVALTIPRLALLDADSGSMVFVARNAHAYIAHVQIMGQSGSAMLISKGLHSGDRVVLVGNDTLRDGQAIHARVVETSNKP